MGQFKLRGLTYETSDEGTLIALEQVDRLCKIVKSYGAIISVIQLAIKTGKLEIVIGKTVTHDQMIEVARITNYGVGTSSNGTFYLGYHDSDGKYTRQEMPGMGHYALTQYMIEYPRL